MKNGLAHYQRQDDYHHTILTLQGEWTTHHLAAVDESLREINLAAVEELTIDATGIIKVDVTGAWVLKRFLQSCLERKVTACVTNTPSQLQSLFNYLEEKELSIPSAFLFNATPFSWGDLVPHVGEGILKGWNSTLQFMEFFGHFLITFGQSIRHPGRLRGAALGNHIFRAGVTALPIIGLISFLIGIVLVYQGAFQLKRFGAEIFTVDLLSVSLLREIGILLTAIVVAGRSGSAFTAQIGTMKLNQEIDALTVMGLSFQEMLVIPRVLALILCLPLLAFYSDMMGLLGGALMCRYYIDLSYEQFFHYLSLGLQPWTFWVGLIKAPFFAAMIALIGCFEGFQVSGNAESIGAQTTRSVVKGIFTVIVLDAFFSIFFSWINV